MTRYLIFILLVICSFSVVGKKHDVKSNIPFEEIEIRCYSPIKKGSFLIVTDQEYYALFDTNHNRETCIDYRLPDIDFENYYLIHLDPLLGGCDEPDIKVELKWFDDESVRVNVKVVEYGNCYRLWHDKVWLKVSKKYYEESVEFNVSRIHKR